MWVRFTKEFDFTPDEDRRVTVAYKPGAVANVRRQCADKAIAAGAAEPHIPESGADDAEPE